MSDIPRDHPETVEESYRRIEADEFWESVQRWERDTLRAEEMREDEDAELFALHVSGDLATVLDLVDWRIRQREDAIEMWRVLHGIGCVLYVSCGSLRIEPVNLVPPRLLQEALALPMREQLEILCDERNAGSDAEDLQALQQDTD